MTTFYKMNGNGNDFIVVNNMDKAFSSDELERLAVKACRRRASVGADGVLALEPSDTADFKMRLFNADGSEGEMCGNGARCTARFAFEQGIVKSSAMDFETLGGNVHAEANGDRATLDLAPVDISGAVIDAPIAACGGTYCYTFLTVGVPHTVIFEKEHSRSFEDYVPLGRAVRNRLDLFPEGTNVNFAEMREDGTLDVMTYERGVEDMTLSCGTGSTASAIAGLLLGLSGSSVKVRNPGGINNVSLEFSGQNTILPKLEGGAVMIARMEILPEALI